VKLHRRRHRFVIVIPVLATLHVEITPACFLRSLARSLAGFDKSRHAISTDTTCCDQRSQRVRRSFDSSLQTTEIQIEIRLSANRERCPERDIPKKLSVPRIVPFYEKVLLLRRVTWAGQLNSIKRAWLRAPEVGFMAAHVLTGTD